MMHRCCCSSSSSQGHVMGTCTCGAFHAQNNSFYMQYPMPNQISSYGDHYEPSMYSSSSSSVDCTLSLGTPSTRLTEDEERRSTRPERRSHVSNSGWDSLQSQTKTSRGSNGNSSSDSLLARRCANCDTTSTPLWRNGPRGPKSLCNACGIRFKKEERRASAAAAAATTVAASDGMMETAQMYSHYNNSWYTPSQSYVDDTDRNEENGIPFLSWTLNYT